MRTEEGEVVPYNMASMEFGSNIDGSGTCLSPYWPVVVAHKIDSTSPLYSLSPRDLATSQAEIIITLEVFIVCLCHSHLRLLRGDDTRYQQHSPGEDQLPPLRDPVGPQV